MATSQPPSRIKATLAASIRGERLACGLTQRQLSDVLDVDSLAVSRWERAKVSPSDENLQRLADVLGCAVSIFYTEVKVTASDRRQAERRSERRGHVVTPLQVAHERVAVARREGATA